MKLVHHINIYILGINIRNQITFFNNNDYDNYFNNEKSTYIAKREKKFN